MPLSAEKVVRVRIAGRVQGVGFRAWTTRSAEREGIRGWVRNLATGEVEAVLAGSAMAVDRLLVALRRGPPGARVASVTLEPARPEDLAGAGPQPGFVQRETT